MMNISSYQSRSLLAPVVTAVRACGSFFKRSFCAVKARFPRRTSAASPAPLAGRKQEVVAVPPLAIAASQPGPAIARRMSASTAVNLTEQPPASAAAKMATPAPTLPQTLDDLVRMLPFVRVLAEKPDHVLDVPAIWPSARVPGSFGVSLPGNREFFRYADLASAQEVLARYQPQQQAPIVPVQVAPAAQVPRATSLDELKKTVAQRWGHQVAVLEARPKRELGYPAIWPSKSVAGGYGVTLPGKGCFVVPSLDQLQPLLADQLAPGQHIQASSTNLPQAARLELMARYNIDITPVILDGKEIAYVFHAKGKYRPTMMFSSHGNGTEGRTFTKPGGVECQFATPDNTVMASRTMEYARRLRDGQIAIAEEQIYVSPPRLNSTNYALDGGIGTQPQDVAQLIGEMNRDGAARPFDFVLLNREAKNVYFADLMTGLQQTMHRLPTTLIAHFCRPKNNYARVFDVLNR